MRLCKNSFALQDKAKTIKLWNITRVQSNLQIYFRKWIIRLFVITFTKETTCLKISVLFLAFSLVPKLTHMGTESSWLIIKYFLRRSRDSTLVTAVHRQTQRCPPQPTPNPLVWWTRMKSAERRQSSAAPAPFPQTWRQSMESERKEGGKSKLPKGPRGISIPQPLPFTPGNILTTPSSPSSLPWSLLWAESCAPQIRRLKP